MKGILDLTSSNLPDRLIKSYEDLERLVRILREMGYSIALTSGTWDVLHIGHDRYLEQAKKLADILIVGVDSDEKVRGRKGKKGGVPRPINGEKERIEMLAFQRPVDIIFVKGVNDEPRRLIKTVKPDVLILSETTGHEEGSIEEMKEWCGRVEVLAPQAPPGEVSTTAKIRMLFISGQEELIKELMPEIIRSLEEEMHVLITTASKRLGTAVSLALQKVIERRDNGGG